jgi:hypothetical protein
MEQGAEMVVLVSTRLFAEEVGRRRAERLEDRIRFENNNLPGALRASSSN